MLCALACFHLGWHMMIDNSFANFVYKNGYWEDFMRADQSKSAYPQLANYIPLTFFAFFSALLVEFTGKRMYVAMIGGLFLLIGNILLITNKPCALSETPNPISGGYDPVCGSGFTMFLPYVLGSMGASVFYTCLLSSISYLSINSIQGFAFGLAFTFINTLHVIMYAIFDKFLNADLLDSGSSWNIILGREFDKADDYLTKTAIVSTVISAISFVFITLAYISDFK